MNTPRVLMCTYGSRGDVEPFLALAQGLRAAGCEILVASSARFREWTESLDIPFFALSDDSLAAIESPDGKTMLEGSSGLINRIAAGVRLAKKAGPINEQLMRETWAAAQAFSPNCIVFHSKLFAAPHVAEQLQVPAFLAMLQPMIVPTAAFPALGLPSLPVPGYNHLTYSIVRKAFSMFRKAVNRFRTDTLGLSPIRSGREVLYPPGAGDIPVLHAYSPRVLARPADWPDNALVTGYWRLHKTNAFTPPRELAAFLEAGSPPVFVGFGSMTSVDSTSLGRTLVSAIRSAGVRAVVGRGWANVSVEHSDDVVSIADTPYDWLFPRMSAVVHHGGAGTTSAGFHAGVPCVICPFFGDQPGWARISVALRVGAQPVPRKRLSVQRLADSIHDAVSNTELRENARRLAVRLHDEDGVKVAVDFILNHMLERFSNTHCGPFRMGP